MPLMNWLRFAAVTLLCSSAALAAQNLPAGTALPVVLSSTLTSGEKAGNKIEGKLKQEVLLPSGAKIKSGSHVTGHIVSVGTAGNPAVHRLTLKFNALQDEHQSIPLNVSLRAMAASENIFQAGLPVDASSTNESSDEWVTKQIGGEVVFRGRGYVASPQAKVGKWSGAGVWGKLSPATDCAGSDGHGQEQSLWVFSTSACGVYGFEGMKIAQDGHSSPIGEVVLESAQDIHIGDGSGWLLVVNSASPTTTK